MTAPAISEFTDNTLRYRRNQLLIGNLIADKDTVSSGDAYEQGQATLQELLDNLAKAKREALKKNSRFAGEGVDPQDLRIATEELEVEISSLMERQLDRLEASRQSVLDAEKAEQRRLLNERKRASSLRSRTSTREASYKQNEISDVLSLPDSQITAPMVQIVRAAGEARATALEEAFRARPEFLEEGTDQQQIEFEVGQLLRGVRNDTEDAIRSVQSKIMNAQKVTLRNAKRFADRDLSSTRDEISVLLKDIDEGTIGILPGIQKYRELIKTLKEQTARSFNLDPNNNFLSEDDARFAQDNFADEQANIDANTEQVVREKKRQAEEKRLRVSKRLADKEVKAIEHEIEELERRIDNGDIGLEAGMDEYRTLIETLTNKMVEAFKADPNNNFLNEEEQVRVDDALEAMKKGVVDNAVRTTQEILKKAGHSGQGVTPDTVKPGGTTPTGSGVGDAIGDYMKGKGRAKTTYEVTTEAIGNLENGFKSLFRTMIDGSASAGDAFKTLGRSMLEMMTEIAISEAAKGFMRLILGTLGGAIGGGGGGLFGNPFGAETVASAAPIGAASGTILPENIGTRGRDSIPHSLMPGEAVLRAKAVRSLGAETVSRMNSMGRDALALESLPPSIRGGQQSEGIGEVNVWIVPPDEKPTLGPRDVLAVISDDISRNGGTAKLIKSVTSGIRG